MNDKTKKRGKIKHGQDWTSFGHNDKEVTKEEEKMYTTFLPYKKIIIPYLVVQSICKEG